MLLVLLMGCSAYDDLFGLLEEPAESPCDERAAWWEDDDGDGAGSPAEVWVSCEQPDGWVAAAGDCDDADATVTTGCDTGDTADTDTGDTADTDTGDTADTDTGEPSDTSGADTSGADTSDTSGADTSDTAAPPAARPAPRGAASSR